MLFTKRLMLACSVSLGLGFGVFGVSAANAEVVEAIAAMVPSEIKESGVLNVAMPDQGPPFNF